MRRLIEPAKSVLIAVLLCTSLLLSARLWLPPTPAAAVREGYRVPFTAPGAVTELNWTLTLQPLSLLVHLPGRGPVQVDPRDEYGRFLWQALRSAAAAVPAAVLEPVADADLARLRRGEARPGEEGGGAAGGGFGIEAALPAGVRLSLWRELWAAAAWPGIVTMETGAPAFDGPIDRIAVLFAAGDAWVLFHGERGHWGARVPVPPPGSSGTAGDMVQYIDSLHQLLHLIASLQLDHEPVEAVGPAAPGLAVAPGLYAAAGGRALPLLQYGPASLSWDRLARSFFARPALIRRVAAGEVVLFTDGEGALTIRPDEGLAEYQAPPAPPPAAGQEAAPAPGPAEALAAAVAFGAEHGGWPGEGDVVLTGVSPIVARGSLSDPQILGYRFQFMQRIDGYLLADRHLAVIEVDARGVVHWRRRFIEDRVADPEGTVAIEIESAAEAVARAAALDFDRLGESSRFVEAAHLVYIGQGSTHQIPAWQLRMHDGTLVWVSAWPGGETRVRTPDR